MQIINAFVLFAATPLFVTAQFPSIINVSTLQTVVMMIQLEDISKYYRKRRGLHYVLRDVNIEIPTDVNVGILGRNGAGKSTLLRMLARAEAPNRGRISSGARLSWPMGFSGGFQSSMSALDNIRFVSRIYGADWREAVDYVEDFAELGDYMYMPVKTFSSGMKARLAVAMSLFVKFDCYLIDEIPGVGDARFRKRFNKVFADIKKHSSLIMVSHSENAIKKYCDIAYILHDARLYRFDDVTEALAIYRGL